MTAQVTISELDVSRLLAIITEDRGDPPAEGLTVRPAKQEGNDDRR